MLANVVALWGLFLSVASCWTIADGGVALAGSGDAGERVRFDQLTGPVELIAGRTLDIAFRIPEAPPLPHQIVLRVAPSGLPAGSLDKEFIVKPRQKKLQGVIPFKQIPAVLRNRNLDVSVFVSGGDSAPYTAKLFDLVVYGDEDAAAAPPVPIIGSGEKLAPLPEIVYTRRADPRHVNPVVALVFVGAIDVLFGALLLALSGIASPAQLKFSVSQCAMLASVLVIELLFVAYYVSWSIFRVISAAAVLLPVVYVSGRRAVPN